jgi:hypothetical protein
MNTPTHVAALFAVSVLFGCACPPPASSSSKQANVIVAKGSFTTTASNGAGQGINIDVVGGPPDLPLSKVKRYTLTLHTALLSTAPVGIDRIEVHVGVLGGATAYDVRVLRQDPATASPFPHPGITVLPYTGTNSYITVFRGADGLGPVEVRFNAYVEVEP